MAMSIYDSTEDAIKEIIKANIKSGHYEAV
jgi:hypothetical protein